MFSSMTTPQIQPYGLEPESDPGYGSELHNEPPQQSVGLHDEINSIIAIVGLCALSE